MISVSLASEEESKPSEIDLDNSLAHGIAWTGGVKWVGQIFSWACTLLVARLLAPADYGIVGMATLFLGFVAIINELGLGLAIMKHRDLTEDQIAQINAVALILGSLSCGISAVAAIPVSMFFGLPQLRWVVLLMGISFVISAFRTVPSSLLAKDLNFRKLALIEGIQTVAQSLTIVVLALLGYGYWALVIGALFGNIVSVSMTMYARFHRFALPQRRSLDEVLTFSWHLLVSSVSWYVQSNSDFLVAGRVLGQAALGAYTIGWTVASVPIDKITSVVSRVTFPVFSARQHDPARLRRYLLMLTEFLGVIILGVSIGMALVAEEFVLIFLGEKWIDAVAPLRLLAVLTVFRTISPLVAQLLNVLGESQFSMRLGLIGFILPLFFYIGSYWGILGITAAWFVVYPVTTVPAYRRVFKKIGLSSWEYYKALWPGLSACFLMTIAVLVSKRIMPEGWHLGLRFGIEISIGGAVYCLAIFLLHRERAKALVQFIKGMKGTDLDPKNDVHVSS